MFTGEPTLTEQFTKLLDTAAIALNSAEEKRKYLGVSRWGEECTRRLFYEYNQTPTDEPIFKGRTLRIFDMGHDAEARMYKYMLDAGFTIRNVKPDGSQFGFSLAKGKLAGHCDGIIDAGPIKLPYPLIWENKALGNKSFNDTVNKKVEKSKPVYYMQMQGYMAYMKCENALFTAINRDTGEVYPELIKYHAATAQEGSDKGVRVIQAKEPTDVPRTSRAYDETYWLCACCPWKKPCWSKQDVKPIDEDFVPFWL